MIETILCGLPIVAKGIGITLGMLAYVVATTKLIIDSKHKGLGVDNGNSGDNRRSFDFSILCWSNYIEMFARQNRKGVFGVRLSDCFSAKETKR